MVDERITSFLEKHKWELHDYQADVIANYRQYSTLLINAPTGTGKTYAAYLPFLNEHLSKPEWKIKNGIKLIWVTPLRALLNDIQASLQYISDEVGANLSIEVRSGDTSSYRKQQQRKSPPDVLITTPESLHVLMSYSKARQYFSKVENIVVDEWHELLGNKRGTLVELALAYLRYNNENILVAGISATIGNLEEALTVLQGKASRAKIITSALEKYLEVITLYPDNIEKYSWAGHLGTSLVKKVLPIIDKSESTIVFTNTRRLAEFWYQALLEANEDLAGKLAIHHGSISKETRLWVEKALKTGRLKAVVATSSLDLGIDFRPVETVIQVSSPKRVSRFLQRAGRSNHTPGKKSKIYFLPTNTLELIEARALKLAIEENNIESNAPIIKPYDVMVQFIQTIAAGDGVTKEMVYKMLTNTHAFAELSEEELDWAFNFIINGGKTLYAYDEYQKFYKVNGVYRFKNRKLQINHRMQIGTIVSDPLVTVKYISGRKIGLVEEAFISKFRPGDTFAFAGRNLKYIRIDGNSLLVRKSHQKPSGTSGYVGGRMELSSKLSGQVRELLYDYVMRNKKTEELTNLQPLLYLQEQKSAIPHEENLVVEYLHTRESYHLYCYPLAGRTINEGIASLLAYRISQELPITFSIAMNDYGFELVSNKKLTKDFLRKIKEFFTLKNLHEDLIQGVNVSEMSKRQFREITRISGLVFQGRPGENRSARSLQTSANLLYDLFAEYNPENYLFKQAQSQSLDKFVHEGGIATTLERLQKAQLELHYIDRSTPFSFAIMVDRLRSQLSSETLAQRIESLLHE